MRLGSKQYSAAGYFDELIQEDGSARPHARELVDYFSGMDAGELLDRQRAVDSTIVDMGISFTIYSEGDNIDRAWPLDLIPRAMPGSEWDRVENGLKQRVLALNLFIDDLYNDRRILKDKIVPKELIDSSKNYLEACKGVRPRHGVWAHICGSDLVRDADGTIYVLEDNLRVPSGVSYMLENRNVIKRVFPGIFRNHRVRPVSEYP
ncbi:MAG: circularly permuted type 2 ATP-grasp protein, partial [Woeseiaceae bacterium]|nr:circularly permuted type 2 ATP-grasp protein [Woeseiaceae bacterium]